MPPGDAPPDALTFEQALAEIERVVRDLEDGRVGLEDSLRRYEEGIALLQRCHAKLRQSEQRIVELIGVNEDGTVRTRPFEHVAKIDQVREKGGA